MRSTKWDGFVWIVLGIVMIGMCFFAAGCETVYQRERVLRSVRVEFGVSSGYAERGTGKDFDEESTWAAVSVAPFAGVGGPDRVIVEATHAAAEPCEKPK